MPLSQTPFLIDIILKPVYNALTLCYICVKILNKMLGEVEKCVEIYSCSDCQRSAVYSL